jgi:sigma-E factor negative regulatory protein RseA
MTKELSALLDGELEVHEAPPLWMAMKSAPQMHETWQAYSLIGDAIRDEGNLARDITASVMRKLEDEPTVLALRSVRQAPKRSSAVLALAASVAGVAVVGWLALPLQFQGEQTVSMARIQQPVPTVVASTGPSRDMQEYMLAHQANAPGMYLQGGAQHIRTVSAEGPAQ